MQFPDALLKPDVAAAVLAAVAAWCAMIAAFLSWRAQVQTLHHTFRPEVLVSGWRRRAPKDGEPDSIAFSELRNVGRDTARNVFVSSFELEPPSGPKYIGGTINLPSLSAGEARAVDGRIMLFWPNVPAAGQSPKILGVTVKVLAWDALGNRHLTMIRLTVFEDQSMMVANAMAVAPGVHVVTQTVRKDSVRKLKVKRWISRRLFGGMLFSDEI